MVQVPTEVEVEVEGLVLLEMGNFELVQWRTPDFTEGGL